MIVANRIAIAVAHRIVIPAANHIAIIVMNLIPCDIFLLEVFTNQLSKKYTITKSISVMKKIFIY